MNKKKKTILIGVGSIVVIAIFAITLSLTLAKGNNNKVYQVKAEEKKENQVGGFLTLMLETEAGSGQYQESTSSLWPGNDYEFNENLSVCENGGELFWNNANNAVVLNSNKSDKCYVYFDKKITLADICVSGELLSSCLIKYYNATGDKDNGLYYHDDDLENGAGDNSYRYAGSSENVNNYVCFGSDAANCPSDNLYRIIGVFGNQVKLIKNTSIGNYNWSGSSSNRSNTWSSSTLNTSTLNGTYLNNLGSAWSNLIANHSWKVGGMSRNNSATAKQYYETEIGSSSSSTTYSAKIGLMYVSDYGFAASPDYWTTGLYSYQPSKSSNWMNININEWTISRTSGGSTTAFPVYSAGYVNNTTVIGSFGVRPVFYLKEIATYISGDGSKENPIQISQTSYADACQQTGSKTLSCHVTLQYIADGDNGLYYHDGIGTYTNADQEAGDNSYRYSGADPNNYVCFGSDDATCPADNLYRIIGIFDDDGDGNYQAKLIKWDYAGSNLLGTDGAYYNSSTDLGDYYKGEQTAAYLYTFQDRVSDSLIENNPLFTLNLNTNYLNNIGSAWSDKIGEYTWRIDSTVYNNILNLTAQTAYTNEKEAYNSAFNFEEYNAKIGLMYVSDYAYAAEPNYWTMQMYRTDAQDYRLAATSNWIYMGLSEWTTSGIYISAAGYVGAGYMGGISQIRPIFYLNSDVTYVSGSGTQSDPIRLS